MPLLLLLPCLIWISFFFLAPLAAMCWRSIASEGFSLEPYAVLFTSPLYTKVILTTVKTASIATVGALVLAYPLAYVLTTASRRLRALILVCVLVPYWVDIIVRSFSWLILLGDNGLINKMLMRLGVIAAPLALLYTAASVLVAMIQILLPLATIVLFGAMLRIDRTLLAAAKIHGASEWQALGFYVTPALLGSPRETMIAQTIMVEASQLLDWSQASAAGAVLLLITTAIAALYNRYFSLDRLWGGTDK
jgi:ABC-type spermidine/putrescine transport system permease subunit I